MFAEDCPILVSLGYASFDAQSRLRHCYMVTWSMDSSEHTLAHGRRHVLHARARRGDGVFGRQEVVSETSEKRDPLWSKRVTK